MEEKLLPQEVREGAFLILFQMLFGTTPEEVEELNPEAFDMAKNQKTDDIVKGVTEHDEELTEIISRYSKTRAVSRISKVNLVILKLALYEMKYRDDVPPKVAINEAVELAKRYSGKSDSGFINGVLNSYMQELKK